MMDAQAGGLSVAGEQTEQAENELFDLGSDKKNDSNLDNKSTCMIFSCFVSQPVLVSGVFTYISQLC